MNTGCGYTSENPLDPTPLSVANRSGLAALRYRVGTHASFFETMKARLATFVPKGADIPPPLAGLTTRDADDPAIAMLDAWALIADVLTFYQERIANEGYLHTATERRSIRALAALVGYTWRPGVASSVYLAYGVQDPGDDAVVPIAASHRVQSMPESGALPQSFETSKQLAARASWNRLMPRQTRPQQPKKKDGAALYFKGVTTNLKPNDPLLFVEDGKPVLGGLARVATVEPQFKEDRTKVTLTAATAKKSTLTVTGPGPLSDPDLLAQLTLLALPPALHPRSAANLPQDVGTSLKPRADAAPQLLSLFRPALRSNLYAAMGNAVVAPPVLIDVYAFRLHAAPFGSSAPLDAVFDDRGALVARREWTLQKPDPRAPAPESFELAISAKSDGTTGNTGLLQLEVILDGHSFKGDNSANRDQIVAVSKEANETVVVTIGDDPDKPDVNIAFTQRHIEIELAETAADKTIITTTKGCDPVALQLIGVAGTVGTLIRGERLSNSARTFVRIKGMTRIPSASMVATEESNVISLDTVDEKVVRDSWIVIERSDKPAAPIIDQALAVITRSRADYGLSGRTTYITLTGAWLAKKVENEDFATVIRGTSVYAESERLELTEAPIEVALNGGELELDGVHGALEPGRWLLVEGERVDIPHIPGMKGAELVMLAGIEHGVSSSAPGETIRTTLKLASPLAYRYALDTVAIYGNVVQATHGELRSEVLGSGDAAQASAQFALRQGPLTYVSAVTPSGVQSTLQVRVNDVLWHEAPRLDGLGPNDRDYVTRSADGGKAIVVFGNGTQGARLPTGVDNIKAVYRTGLGMAGNVPAGKVNQLVMRPPGVVSVINPLPASGGADSEAQDEARRNAPLGVMALDRLVSIQDYADFARTFAGVGKATAARIAAGHRQTVFLTIGGADEAVLEQASDLCLNLAQAVQRFGDPHQPVLVAPGEAVLLVLVAKVRVDSDYLWDSVMPAVRSALLDVLGYRRRDFGQDVVLSEVISTIQQVPGVDYVDVDRMDSISAATMMDDMGRISSDKAPKPRLDERVRALPARLAGAGHKPQVLPAQIVYLSAAVASLLTLTELP